MGCVPRPPFFARYAWTGSLFAHRETGELALKYLCLVYGEDDEASSIDDARSRDSDSGLRDSSACLVAERLEPADSATTIRILRGELLIGDGPFALGQASPTRFYLIDVRDLNQAILLAQRLLLATDATVEIRRVATPLVEPPRQTR